MELPQLTDRSWADMTTIRLGPEGTPSSESVASSPSEEESVGCDLSELLRGGGWPGDATLTVGARRLELHMAIVEGCRERLSDDISKFGVKLESYARARQPAEADGAEGERLTSAARAAYGGDGASSRARLRKRLLELVDTGHLADAVAERGGTRARVHRCVLGARSAYFSAAFRYSSRLELPASVDEALVVPLLRYVYTAHCDDLEALLDAATSLEGDDGAEPALVRLAYCLDELLLAEAKKAAVDRLIASLEPANAASLLAVSARLASPSLGVACLDRVAMDPDGARRPDPQLFDDILPEDVKRTLPTLVRMAQTNPVGRGRFADAREAVAVLRESLDEQTERLAAAIIRQSAEPTNAEIDAVLKRRQLRVDYLKDYVQTQERLLFGSTRGDANRDDEPPGRDRDNDDDDFCYDWRPIRSATVPPGLEVRLVFGGQRAARIPVVWPLVLRLPPPSRDVFRRQVTQTTTVAEVLQDARRFAAQDGRCAAGPRLALLDETGIELDTTTTFHPRLWRHRDRLELRWLLP